MQNDLVRKFINGPEITDEFARLLGLYTLTMSFQFTMISFLGLALITTLNLNTKTMF